MCTAATYSVYGSGGGYVGTAATTGGGYVGTAATATFTPTTYTYPWMYNSFAYKCPNCGYCPSCGKAEKKLAEDQDGE